LVFCSSTKKRDQGSDAFDAVEGVEEEPLMFEGAPPRLDHRVGLGDLDLGDDAVKAFGEEGGLVPTSDLKIAFIDPMKAAEASPTNIETAARTPARSRP
jgi:hypothetical protein